MLRLLEQVPETERGLPVHLVVGGLPRVPDPAHALLPVSGYEGLLRLPLPLGRGAGLERAPGAGCAHTVFHPLPQSLSEMDSITSCPVEYIPMLYLPVER